MSKLYRGYFNKFIFIVASITLIITAFSSSYAKTTVIHFVANHGEPFFEYLEERAQVFNELHPDIEVVVEQSAGNYTEAVYSRILSGMQINVLDSTHSYMVFSAMNMLADLRPYLEKEDFAIEEAIIPYALDVLGHEGSIRGIPSQVHHITTIYNRTMFEEAGLSTLKQLGDGWSWQWLLDDGAKLSRDTSGDGIVDQYAARFARSLIHIDSVVHQAGGMLYDRYLDPTESRFDTDPVYDGLEFLLSLDERNIGSPSVPATSIYTNRGAAINMSGTISAHFIHYDTSSDHFEVTAQPMGPVRRGGHTYFGPYHVMERDDPEEIDASYQWIRFLAFNEESQIAMMDATRRIPAYVPVLRNLLSYLDDYTDEEREFVWDYAVAAMEPYNFPHYLTPAEADIQTAFNPGFADVFAGRQSLSNFLIHMHQLVNVELERVR